jgi:16S rRNA (cytosine1402-N4)-methyltransferase
MGALQEMLLQAKDILKPRGIIAVITFQSLEDRIVKNFFKRGKFEDAEVDEVYGIKEKSPFIIITKKPLVATQDEIKINSRARSAKLRLAKKN